MPYHFKIYKESSGFWTECLELNGCYTQGDTLKEKDALHTYFDDPVLISFPTFKEPESIIEVCVDSLTN